MFNWLKIVDIGIRTRHVFEGSEVNLYPFTRNGMQWLQQNIQIFTDPAWSQEERCFKLSSTDSTTNFSSVIRTIQENGLRIKFYGRLCTLNMNLPEQDAKVFAQSKIPRMVVVSAIIQIVLFAEPMWRAIKLESLVSVIATSLIVTMGSFVVLQATVFRKPWARDGLAALALLSFIWAVVSGALFASDDPQFRLAAATSIPNLIAVALLYAPVVDRWFNEGVNKKAAKPR